MEKTVYFRAFEEEDAELIYKWMNDDNLKKMSVGVNRRMCRDEALDWVRARMKDSRNNLFLSICENGSNDMIGYVCLTDIHYIHRSANFSGIVIGNPDYRDGQAYIESYLFILEYAFERLNLNRLYGSALAEHKTSVLMAEVMFEKVEGILRQSVFKNGKYYDELICAILKDEYFEHKNNGDYEMSSILNRILIAKRKGRSKS